MINPDAVTNFSRSDEELEEFLLFCIAVAGHNAHTTARTLEQFMETARAIHYSPFEYIRAVVEHQPFGVSLAETLKLFKFGCYTKLAKSMLDIATSDINLRTCSVVDLENQYGIGPKTARFFLLHSRPAQNNIAVLDTHVLKYLAVIGVEVPKGSPTGRRYAKLEQAFLQHAKSIGVSNIADFDLTIWRNGRVGPSTTETEVMV
jgi:thermostable 8-oxoguanine DNA glycosylase